MQAHPIRPKICCLALFVVLTSLWSVEVQASPSYQSSDPLVRICYDTTSCRTPDRDNSDSSTLDIYTQQVLANEWHGDADMEALKAGAIAIRTFPYRELSCGAFLRMFKETEVPVTYSRLLHNTAQRFRLGDNHSASQNPVSSDHIQARSETGYTVLFRDATGTHACAKYDANTGDPTKACPSGVCSDSADRTTLQSVADPVSDDVGSQISIGMSQNGSAAWNIGDASWDYRQILTHYYAKVVLADSSNDNRWVWLNVGDETVFEGYDDEEYFGPENPSPSRVYLGGSRPVSIRVQNTGRSAWGNNVKLSYRWYDEDGSDFINQGPEASVTSLNPGANKTLNLALSPPTGAVVGGCYTLKWDMKRDSTWFSSQNDWPTLDSSACAALDTIPPTNPPPGGGTPSSGHVLNGWSTQTQIAMSWSGAHDDETGVSGYSVAWDQIVNTLPDDTQDVSTPAATSGILGQGNWYLHVRTRDNAGNWAASGANYGPYGIDTSPPTSSITNTPVVTGTSWFYLTVSATDSGAGVDTVRVQYNVDNGAWQTYAHVVGGGPRILLFTPSRYNRGHTYHLRTQATDRLGLVESLGGASLSVTVPLDANPAGLIDMWMPFSSKDN